MKFIDIFSIVTLISLIHFSIDYLSDEQITSNETKIGMLQILHHLVITIQMFGIFVNNLPFKIIAIMVSFGIQLGYLVNNDHCWLTTMVNKLINPEKPDRIWRVDLILQIKHYLRGSEWAYRNINNFDQTGIVLFSNTMYILFFIKNKYLKFH